MIPRVALSKSDVINFLIFLRMINDKIKIIGIDKINPIISDNPVFSKMNSHRILYLY